MLHGEKNPGLGILSLSFVAKIQWRILQAKTSYKQKCPKVSRKSNSSYQTFNELSANDSEACV